MTEHISDIFIAHAGNDHLASNGMTEQMRATPGLCGIAGLHQTAMDKLAHRRSAAPRPVRWLRIEENGTDRVHWATPANIGGECRADFLTQRERTFTTGFTG